MGWVVVGGWVVLDYNVSSGPFLSYEIEIEDGPGPELDNKKKELTNYIVGGRYVTGKTVSSKNIDGTHPELHLGPNPQTLNPVLLRLAMRPRGHRPP